MNLSPDHQVAALLLLAGLIGAVIWALRWIDRWAARRYQEARDGAAQRAPRPEFERSHFGRRPAPGLQMWSPEIEAEYAAGATEDELARVEAYVNDLPFDVEREGL